MGWRRCEQLQCREMKVRRKDNTSQKRKIGEWAVHLFTQCFILVDTFQVVIILWLNFPSLLEVSLCSGPVVNKYSNEALARVYTVPIARLG